MTQDEFQKRYHEYLTQDKDEALREAKQAMAEGIDGDECIAVCLTDVGWCLMLESAVQGLIESGVEVAT